jgi:hypothetical protein
MQRPCEHCGNPDKSKWQSDCKYKGDWPSRRAFVLSTFDPPCACDDYDETMRSIARTSNRKIGILLLLLAAVMAACWHFAP